MKAECLNIGDYFRWTNPRAYPGSMFCVVNIHPDKTSLSGSSPLIEVVDQYEVTHWFPKETEIDKMETLDNGKGIVNRVVISPTYEVYQLLDRCSGAHFQIDLIAYGADEPECLFSAWVKTESEMHTCTSVIRETVTSILKHCRIKR